MAVKIIDRKTVLWCNKEMKELIDEYAKQESELKNAARAGMEGIYSIFTKYIL